MKTAGRGFGAIRAGRNRGVRPSGTRATLIEAGQSSPALLLSNQQSIAGALKVSIS
jgi:hypothetical protein